MTKPRKDQTLAYAVTLKRLIEAGIDLCQDLDGFWEIRFPRNEAMYTAPKAIGQSIETALAAYLGGQRLCSTVGCQLPYQHNQDLSPTCQEHQASGPKTKYDWTKRSVPVGS